MDQNSDVTLYLFLNCKRCRENINFTIQNFKANTSYFIRVVKHITRKVGTVNENYQVGPWSVNCYVNYAAYRAFVCWNVGQSEHINIITI